MFDLTDQRPSWEDQLEAARILNEGQPGHDVDHPTLEDDGWAAAAERAELERLRRGEELGERDRLSAEERGRERLAVRYLDALDAGDLDAVAEIWGLAAADPMLEALLREMDEGLEDGAREREAG